MEYRVLRTFVDKEHSCNTYIQEYILSYMYILYIIFLHTYLKRGSQRRFLETSISKDVKEKSFGSEDGQRICIRNLMQFRLIRGKTSRKEGVKDEMADTQVEGSSVITLVFYGNELRLYPVVAGKILRIQVWDKVIKFVF